MPCFAVCDFPADQKIRRRIGCKPLTRNGESVKKPTAPFGRKQTLIDI